IPGNVAWNNAGQNAGTVDSATFVGTVGATVTIGTPITVNHLTFNPTGTGSYTLTNPSGANAITLSGPGAGIISTTGLNTIRGRVLGTGSINSVAAGSLLTLSNTNTGALANSFTGASFTVASTGTLRANVSSIGNNLSGAAITLNGGTLSLNPSAT